MKKILLTLLGSSLFFISIQANSQQFSATIEPSLTIDSSCSIDASNVNGQFAGQTSGSTANGIIMQGGNLKVTCLQQNFLVGADAGINQATAGDNQRRLKSGSTFISYKLLIAGVPWGDQQLGSLDPSYNETMLDPAYKDPSSTNQNYQITGVTTKALTGTESLGIYTDTVTITIVW